PFVAGEETAGATFIEASNTLVIVGVNNNRTIQISVVDPEPGTYDLGANSTLETHAIYKIDGQNTYSTLLAEGGSGTVTITSLDFASNEVSGTFSFEAGRDGGNQTVSVTNGIFTDLYVEIDTSGNQPLSDFYAEINGVPYTPGGRLATYEPNYSSIDIEGFIPNSIERIRLRIKNPGVGTFMFGIDDDTVGMYFKPGTYLYSTNLHPDGGGSVTITEFDLVNEVISGTFEFFAINADDETVDVTNGSFNNVHIIIN